MLSDISKIKRLDEKQLIDTLIEALRIIDNLLKFVSELVKKALQVMNHILFFLTNFREYREILRKKNNLKAKKTSGPNDQLAQQAEKLLQSNKPLTQHCHYFVTLLTSDDSDISESACKILWIMMQLFGTDLKDLLNKENLNIFL